MTLKLTTYFVFFLISFLSYAIKPSDQYITTPDKFDLPVTDTLLASTNNALISTWFIQHDTTPKGTFLLAYGDAGNKSFLVQHAYMFYHQGYDVVMFDYRGFGGSSQFDYDSLHLYHSQYFDDFVTAYDFAKAANKGPSLHIYAQSMGSIFATRVVLPESSFLILDSPVLNIKFAVKALKNNKKKKLSRPDLPPLVVPNNVILFYGTNDYLIRETDINVYCNGTRHVVYATKTKHLKSLSRLQASYFEFIEIGMK